MKNIRLIPTDKPSRLSILNSGKLNFGAEIMSSSNSKPQHSYITNNEKIKKDDWCFNPKTNKIIKVGHYGHYGHSSKKIILTTDTDLIADGVQGIDDEFLEWFVKNPTCESVEVYHQLHKDEPLYKIIIPQKEPNPFELPKALPDDVFYKSLEGKQQTYWIGIVKWNDGTILRTQPFYEYDNGIKQWSSKFSYENSGKFEWIDYKKVEPESALNSERMYSEEDMKNALIMAKEVVNEGGKDLAKYSILDILKQFKK